MTLPVLCYHAVTDAAHPAEVLQPGSATYAVTAGALAAHLAALRAVADVLVTFDDALPHHAEVTLEILATAAVRAVFFLDTDRIGRPGGISEAGVAALARAGHRVGAHGASHRFLSDLSDADLAGELARARDAVARIAGLAPDCLSLPGGRGDRRVVDAALAAGYRSVYTSRPGTNPPLVGRVLWDRIVVRRRTSVEDLIRSVTGRRRVADRAGWLARIAARRVLGDRAYSAIHRSVMP